MKLEAKHWKIIRAFSLGGIVIATVLVFRSQSLYTTCPVGFEHVQTDTPIESTGNDPAFFAQETIAPVYESRTRMAELGFDHIVGMFNVTTAYPCDRGKSAQVELRVLRILEQTTTSGDWIVAREIRFDQSLGKLSKEIETLTYRRTPWFTGGVPWLRIKTTEVQDGALQLMAGSVPQGIIHGWTVPRLVATDGKRYALEAELRVTGDARLQLGMDYWRGAGSLYNGWSEDCTTSNNCQAWLSDWLGDTGGEFVTWRVPNYLFR